VKIPLRMAGAVVLSSVVMLLAPSVSHAGLQGDSRWCAVTDTGAENTTWDCEYDTVEECRPAVLNANRGFCALNPYWRPNADKDKD